MTVERWKMLRHIVAPLGRPRHLVDNHAAPARRTLIGHLKATGMIAFMVQILSAVVLSVSRDSAHRFTKPSCEAITLLEGLGVAGDAHLGVTVQHRSRVVADPSQPNLRQVHLIHSELFAEVAAVGFTLRPGTWVRM